MKITQKKDKNKVTIWLAMAWMCTSVWENNAAIIEYPHCHSVLT